QDDDAAADSIGEPASGERPGNARKKHGGEGRRAGGLGSSEHGNPIERNEGVEPIEHDGAADDRARQSCERRPSIAERRIGGDGTNGPLLLTAARSEQENGCHPQSRQDQKKSSFETQRDLNGCRNRRTGGKTEAAADSEETHRGGPAGPRA